MADAEVDPGIGKNCFFDEIKKESGINLSKHLILLLDLSGFNNLHSFAAIEESDLIEMETLVQGDLKDIIGENEGENFSDFLDVFRNKPNKFRFFPGEKKLIWAVRDHCREKINFMKMLIPHKCGKSKPTDNKSSSTSSSNNAIEEKHSKSAASRAVDLTDDSRNLRNIINNIIREKIKNMPAEKQAQIKHIFKDHQYTCQMDEQENVMCNIICPFPRCKVNIKVGVRFLVPK